MTIMVQDGKGDGDLQGDKRGNDDEEEEEDIKEDDNEEEEKGNEIRKACVDSPLTMQMNFSLNRGF